MWGCSHYYCRGRVRVVSCPSSVFWVLCICDYFVVVRTFFSELGGRHGFSVTVSGLEFWESHGLVGT